MQLENTVFIYLYLDKRCMLTAQYDKICNEIFKFDRKIRYAAILDETGRIIAGGMRRGVQSLEPQSEDLRLIASITMQLNADRSWDKYFGKTQFNFIKRERVNILTFYLGRKLVLVSMEPDFSLQRAEELRNQITTNYESQFI